MLTMIGFNEILKQKKPKQKLRLLQNKLIN